MSDLLSSRQWKWKGSRSIQPSKSKIQMKTNESDPYDLCNIFQIFGNFSRAFCEKLTSKNLVCQLWSPFTFMLWKWAAWTLCISNSIWIPLGKKNIFIWFFLKTRQNGLSIKLLSKLLDIMVSTCFVPGCKDSKSKHLEGLNYFGFHWRIQHVVSKES